MISRTTNPQRPEPGARGAVTSQRQDEVQPPAGSMTDDGLAAQVPSTPIDPTLPRLVPIRQVAAALGLHPHTVVRMAQRGAIPAVRIGSRGDWYCEPAAIRAWLDGLYQR